MGDKLIGMRVRFTVSDPWEFGTEHGTGPFLATIVGDNLTTRNSHGDQGVLLQLAVPLVFQNTNCEYFVAQPRHTGDTLATLRRTPVFCNLTAIPNDKALSGSPFDLSWWRGGVGLIGTLESA